MLVQKIPQALEHDADARKGNTCEGEIPHYTTGTAVTLWSEGGMAAKGGTAPQSSFGRTVSGYQGIDCLPPVQRVVTWLT